MITFDEIIQTIRDQKLIDTCVSETQQMTNRLQEYLDPDKVQQRIDISTVNGINIRIFYITYDQISDEFLFHRHGFKKINDVWNYIDSAIDTKWIHTVGNEYVLMYNQNEVNAGKVFHDSLPVIIRNG